MGSDRDQGLAGRGFRSGLASWPLIPHPDLTPHAAENRFPAPQTIFTCGAVSVIFRPLCRGSVPAAHVGSKMDRRQAP